MAYELRHDWEHLYLIEHIRYGTPLEGLLVEGRLLQSVLHDLEGDEDAHFYRKVLKTYDPETGHALLSKEGSRRLPDKLEEPDREYSEKDLYEEGVKMWWKVKDSDHELS